MSKSSASRTASRADRARPGRSAAAVPEGIGAEAEAVSPAAQRQKERARLRRQIARGRSLAQQRRPQEAIEAYREARDTAALLAQAAPAGRALADLSRIDRLIGEEARRLGDVAGALEAFRTAHAALTDFIAAHPGDTERVHDLTRVRAALRDTLREAQDDRLAIAAGRMAAANAQALAEQFPDDSSWTIEAMNQRMALAKILRKADPEQAYPAYFEVIRTGRRIAEARPLEGIAWDIVKRAHLDLADLQQAEGLRSDALATLSGFRTLVSQRRDAAPELGGRALDAALERYLTGLILAASGDDTGALAAFGDGLTVLDELDPLDFLTTSAQQHRGRIIAHAEKAASRIGDEDGLALLRTRMLARLEYLMAESDGDAKQRHALVSHAYDLARTLIDKEAPELAVEALTFAEEVLEAQALGHPDRIYVDRWRAFLKLELGRAWREGGDREGAIDTFGESLTINGRLSREDPADIRAQCDAAYAEWQLALLTREGREDRFRRARGTLRFLERSGRLPPYARGWIGRIEQDMYKA